MSLAAAYARTDYRILLPRPLSLRAGRRPAPGSLRAQCGRHARWAVLTPCNPRSRRLSAKANARRLRQLERLLRRQGIRHWSSVNRDPRGRWPDEPGWLLLDAGCARLLKLGRRFRQNALLTGCVGRVARLCWL